MAGHHAAYPPEFKRQMVELVRSGRSPEELAREFEPSAGAIRTWVKQADLDEGVRPSMGSVGIAYDNAMCESFVATLECELLARKRFKTQAEARMPVFDFIEGFYNPRRRHSALGQISPLNFERRHGVAACVGRLYPRLPGGSSPLHRGRGLRANLSVHLSTKAGQLHR